MATTLPSKRLFVRVLVAGPRKVLFGREDSAILVETKLSFEDMADHWVRHGGASVVEPGCMITSRIDTVLKPGIIEGFSPILRTTTPGHGLVSPVCEAAGLTMAAEAASNPIRKMPSIAMIQQALVDASSAESDNFALWSASAYCLLV